MLINCPFSTEHWERLATRAGAASQPNSQDGSRTGLTSTNVEVHDSRTHAEMTTLEMGEEDLGSSLLGGDLTIDFSEPPSITERAPSITAESPVSLVRTVCVRIPYAFSAYDTN